MPEQLFVSAGAPARLESGNAAKAGLTSILIHACVACLLLVLGSFGSRSGETPPALNQRPLSSPLWSPPKWSRGPSGGGGGDRSPTPASKGELPRAAPRIFTPPTTTPINRPTLPVEMAIEDGMPRINPTVIGNPIGTSTISANGDGRDVGIGRGAKGGVGDETGPRTGAGPNTPGGTVYRPSQVTSAPVPIFKVEPEYSEDARKAKLQGNVLVTLIVDEFGRPTNIRVTRPLGLGLDERAIEAISKWRFRPGVKDGKPVPVHASIEVNFRLL